MIDAAIRLARSAGYTNAGTAEFLVDGAQFYFLEVNARLQVEHPVTEIRFGCDLVAEQLKLAAGGRVSPPLEPRGCAIECRIYAEDSDHGFRPAVGTVLGLRLPAGPGVRFDTHLTNRTEVSAFYDGLLGKLICFGAEREEARRRMLAAFDEFAILGVTNTAAFLRDLVASEEFKRADLSTRFLERFSIVPDPDEIDAALVAAALVDAGMIGSGSSSVLLSADGAAPANRSPWSGLRDFELWRRQ